MKRSQSIEEFYKSRFQWIPQEIRNILGHFNVFPLEYPAIGCGAKPLEYAHRDWYNIVLVYGGGILQCMGSEYQVKEHAVAFTNPHTPFGWRERDKITKGYFCLFNEQFLQNEKRITQYPPFKSNTAPFCELTLKEATEIESLFLRMTSEANSDYIYKYHVIQLLIEEMLHLIMKSISYEAYRRNVFTAAQRLTIQFMELLERQFLIEEPTQTVRIRTASDFARILNVHVNHLNRSIKQSTGKNTSQIIQERIMREAQNFLQLTNWNVAEIAFVLGFKEATHFNNFFKKSTGLSPTQFRNT